MAQIGFIGPSPDFGRLYDGLADIFAEYANADEASVSVGIFSEGEAAAYAMVWEWGNARQTKKGPKTTRGISPDGEEAWLTIQAPYGYIRVNILKYFEVIDQEMSKIDFSQGGNKINNQVKRATKRISDRIVKIIQDSVPVDSGALQESIVAYTEIDMFEDEDED
jgi:hypothetical protein